MDKEAMSLHFNNPAEIASAHMTASEIILAQMARLIGIYLPKAGELTY